MLKRISILAALVLLGFSKAVPEPQIPAPAGNPITLTTGTAVRLVPNPSTAQPIRCNSLFIQVQANGSALAVVYVLNAPPNVTAVKDGSSTTTVAQLAPGTATQPGGAFSFPGNSTATSGSGGFDLRYWAVQGSTGDTVLASCDIRN